MSNFAPTSLRASEMARCVRMCYLRSQHGGGEEHDDLTRRYFARGHLYAEYVCRQLEAKHGKDNVQREVPIEWPLGTGHADAYIVPAKLLVEIKSTALPSISSPMSDMAVLQNKIYQRFHPESERGAVYLINPSDLSGEEVFDVGLTDDDITEIDAAVASIQAALDGGALPERICTVPGQGRSRLCPFVEPCFADWIAPAPGSVEDPDAVDLAAKLAALKRDERPLKDQLSEIEQERKDVQFALAELVPEGETVVGPWMVTRTLVQRAPVFAPKLAKAAGFPMHTLDEFMRPGAEYETFRVKTTDEVGAIEYGQGSSLLVAPTLTCGCGACRKCKHRIYMRTWYARNADKARATAVDSRARNVARARAYDRERDKTRIRDPIKVRAGMAVTHAIERGQLERQPCEVCGGKGEAHHEDYSRPLDIRWLCRKHHMERHRVIS